ncbi:hypothetical protein DEH18_01465 [Streptomyces sp. NHF165]|nr:hypothetical protein DEH18_01465 [Streptomyces sp. NHF165]
MCLCAPLMRPWSQPVQLRHELVLAEEGNMADSRKQRETREQSPSTPRETRQLPLLGACGCGPGCGCGCQSGGPCQCGGSCG